jgi:hypothetical protein
MMALASNAHAILSRIKTVSGFPRCPWRKTPPRPTQPPTVIRPSGDRGARRRAYPRGSWRSTSQNRRNRFNIANRRDLQFAARLIWIPSAARVWIATALIDLRRGMQGLALTIQEGLKRHSHGDLYNSEVAAAISPTAPQINILGRLEGRHRIHTPIRPLRPPHFSAIYIDAP